MITIENDVLEAMNGLWKRCMIVKVLGRNMSISVVSRKLKELWKGPYLSWICQDSFIWSVSRWKKSTWRR